MRVRFFADTKTTCNLEQTFTPSTYAKSRISSATSRKKAKHTLSVINCCTDTGVASACITVLSLAARETAVHVTLLGFPREKHHRHATPAFPLISRANLRVLREAKAAESCQTCFAVCFARSYLMTGKKPSWCRQRCGSFSAGLTEQTKSPKHLTSITFGWYVIF